MIWIKGMILELLPDLSPQEPPDNYPSNHVRDTRNLKNKGTNPAESSNSLDSSRILAPHMITLDRFKNTHDFFKDKLDERPRCRLTRRSPRDGCNLNTKFYIIFNSPKP